MMRDDIALYRSLGIESITTFALGLNEEYEARYGEQPLLDYGALLRDA
ncbi:MAG: hypothetical protein KKH75_04300 [Actinobacteria bacterium]|nr:hypothetical protein [Actinomycetota bacterium]